VQIDLLQKQPGAAPTAATAPPLTENQALLQKLDAQIESAKRDNLPQVVIDQLQSLRNQLSAQAELDIT